MSKQHPGRIRRQLIKYLKEIYGILIDPYSMSASSRIQSIVLFEPIPEYEAMSKEIALQWGLKRHRNATGFEYKWWAIVRNYHRNCEWPEDVPVGGVIERVFARKSMTDIIRGMKSEHIAFDDNLSRKLHVDWMYLNSDGNKIALVFDMIPAEVAEEKDKLRPGTDYVQGETVYADGKTILVELLKEKLAFKAFREDFVKVSDTVIFYSIKDGEVDETPLNLAYRWKAKDKKSGRPIFGKSTIPKTINAINQWGKDEQITLKIDLVALDPERNEYAYVVDVIESEKNDNNIIDVRSDSSDHNNLFQQLLMDLDDFGGCEDKDWIRKRLILRMGKFLEDTTSISEEDLSQFIQLGLYVVDE